ncbi:adhesion G-protein coupled receptor F1-like isoform X2 [Takifugu rubripes]|uniref:adhesion G-protein coupled receptor F1-like isoform X2 n=1 Tax=Takifugu rubripes TaxID=31033 RepID=UPI001145D823|nr:adhesion G-protein coupled receptor F1-like isoform X2 [Takifugu rubripes]
MWPSTTGCASNTNETLQCHCEEQFFWSCDLCEAYGACKSPSGTGPCQCINQLPPDGQLCRATPNITQCPATTPGSMSTTTALPTTTSTDPTTATPTIMASTTTMTSTEPTTAPPTTTASTPITRTSATAATTRPTSTASTTTAPPIIEERLLSFTMDLEFDPSFNSLSNELYQYTSSVIQRECRKHISGLENIEIKEFRPGSTVVDYIVKATYIQDVEIIAAETGIFNKLAENYSMILDNQTPLQFEPPEVFFGRSVTVTCGPPPRELGFGPNTKAEWRLNGALVHEDELHRFSSRDGAATLTISTFFVTDNGKYECKLTDSSLSLNIVVRQKSSGSFTLKSTPLIQVTPVRLQVACKVGKEVFLKCSVNSPYTVVFKDIPAAGEGSEISHRFSIPSCQTTRQTFICQEKNFIEYKEEIVLVLSTKNFVCFNDSVFGDGMLDDEAVGPCEPNEVGEQTAVCRANGVWELSRNGCILKPIQELLEQSQKLNNNSLPVFLDQLRSTTVNFKKEVVESTPTITAIVDILENVGERMILLVILITKTSIEDVLITTGILTIDEGKESWDFINFNDTQMMSNTKSNIPKVQSVSGSLLKSLEILTSGLSNDSFDIHTPFIILNKTTFSNTFAADFNSSVQIEIPAAGLETNSLTVMTFNSMDNVLPPRDKVNSSLTIINGKVVLIQSNGNIRNVSLSFDIQNDTFSSPQCVFWNFTLFDRLGGWDSKGCELVGFVNGTVTCNCNHLTSFSILMSPFSLNNPALDYITFIGVGISMASLVICIIIEAVIWSKISRNNTSYLRHVSIVNIAVSLLIADIWFIIGAAISDAEEINIAACMAATFFIHFFYLALFFWMLASALLLLYRTVSVFDDGLSKQSMLAIGFCLGYGAPLIIAVITIAVTAPSKRYIRATGVCWLNWDESKALLAFVIPALLIVVINLLILIVVLYKILRRRAMGDAAQAEERHVLVVIARALAVLTPFFGLTWGLGVGTMVSPFNEGIHIAFAFFNSLQGFFILLFGTLLDKKVRSEIAIMSQASKSGTRSTSAGTTSSSGLGFFRNWRRGGDGYNISSTSGGSNRYSNT